MIDIDWSKAPTGAVCAMVANFSSSAVKPGDVEFPESEHVAECFAVGPNSWTRVERPSVWDGSGLPPVGVECEVTKGERVDWSASDESLIGQNVTVKAIFRNALDQGIASVERNDGRCECILADLLKPVKTPEQLAAEQREKVIREIMHDSTLKGAGWICYDAAAALYDAGYRKHD